MTQTRARKALLPGIHAAAIAWTLAPIAYVMIATVCENGRLDWTPLTGAPASVGRWGHLLANTGLVSAVALLVSIPAGFALAWILGRTDVRLSRLAVALLVAAAAFPLYAMAGTASVLGAMVTLRGSLLAVGVLHGFASLPLVTLILWSGFAHTPATAEEQAQIDGAPLWRIACNISLPAASGKIAVAAVVVLVSTTTDYTLTDLFQVRTFAEEVYTQFALHGRAEEPAVACLPLVVILGTALWSLRGPLLGPRPSGDPTSRTQAIRLRSWREPFTALTVAVGLATALLPIVSVTSTLRNRGGRLETTTWFFEELAVSMTTALLAAILCTAFAVGLAWHAARRRRWRVATALWIAVSLAVPAPILAIGLIGILNRPMLGAIYDSPAVLVVAYWIRFLPIATLFLIPFFANVPRETESAAKLDGASTPNILYRVAAPQCLAGILLCGVVVGIAAVGELPCSVMVTPPGHVTVTHRFFSLIHYGMYPDAAILCLTAVACVFTLSLGAMAILLRRSWSDSRDGR